METEVCSYSLLSVEKAAEAGATRVELCASHREGGLTPSLGMVRLARKRQEIELSVMVRPRGGDFLYTDDEYAVMLADVELLREAGADCVVSGLLLPNGDVDIPRTRELVKRAGAMEVTFHRAFDMVKDRRKALEDIISTGCRRILTSGGEQTAEQGLEAIRELVKQAAGRIEIMAGSGVNSSNVSKIIAAGVDAVHFSAGRFSESKMLYRHSTVALSDSPGQDYRLQWADYEEMTKIIRIAKADGGSLPE